MHVDWIHIGALFLVALVAGVTALGTFLVWRRGFVKGWHAARSESPVCPKCRYDLKGLSQCRCPECGTEYRLDELWRTPVIPSAAAGQRARNQKEKIEGEPPGRQAAKEFVA